MIINTNRLVVVVVNVVAAAATAVFVVAVAVAVERHDHLRYSDIVSVEIGLTSCVFQTCLYRCCY